MPLATRIPRTFALTLIAAALVACSTGTVPPQTRRTEATTPPVATTAAATEVAATATTAADWRFPAGSRIAGVDVGNKTPETAIKLVSLGLNSWQKPLALVADEQAADPPTLKPYKVGLDPDIAQMVAEAEHLAREGKPVDIEWTPQVDEAKLRAELEALAPSFEQTAASDIVTDTEALTSTFTFRAQPGVKLDIDATAALVSRLLTDRSEAVTQTVVLHTTSPQERDLATLKHVLEEHLGYWKGVGAIYVHDLETGQSIGINENSVFSGASVMKVPIMIYVYAKLGKLDEQQREWMENVVINSDNLDANALLAAAVGGQGTEAALEGVNEMSQMLEGLGLEHTYQLIPYESGEWLIQQSRLPQGGPKREGQPPYTAADPYVRTTPREMGQLFVMLAECAEGKGPLIEKYGDKLNETLCDEMIGWLERPHDQERMVAGIPAGVPVAHKGGWIDDMQSDVGIVSSPNGRYVAAIYIWRPDGYVTNAHATPSPYLGDFSHTIYTFFNPESVE
ncbi:MAG TPA: serine hydrolase [Herpetosiphonaceae bacterium]